MGIRTRYSTFASLAGADAFSDKSTAPTPLESVNLWPWLSGAVSESPRLDVVYDHRQTPAAAAAGLPANASGALRVGDWKLFVGPQKQASWFGEASLLFSMLQISMLTVQLCS